MPRKKKFSLTQKKANLLLSGIVQREEGRGGECALCEVVGSSCEGCPVMQYTGKGGCNDTPYWNPERFRLPGDSGSDAIIRFGYMMLDKAGYKVVEKYV